MRETVVCAGAVVMRADQILLVRQAKGHQLEGQWTIPWGRVDAGESPSTAAVREAEEESGILTNVAGLIGAQELPPPWEGWIGLIYLCNHVGGTPTPDGRETDDARFFSLAELDVFLEPVERWCYWLSMRMLAGKFTLTESDSTNPYLPTIGFI